MYDSATENISHSFENLHAQGINEVIGNELAIEENVIDNVEGNGSDQESDTDSENKVMTSMRIQVMVSTKMQMMMSFLKIPSLAEVGAWQSYS